MTSPNRSDPLNKPQESAAIVICALGLLVATIGAAVLLLELKKERAACARLEKEVAALQAELKRPLGTSRMPRFFSQ